MQDKIVRFLSYLNIYYNFKKYMSDFRSLFMHSRNYMFAQFATKALGFISIPIFTRLLSVQEYGVFSVFIATVAIFTSILSLSTETAISRYYFDAKDLNDFKRFVGTTTVLVSIIFFINTIIFLLLSFWICRLLNFELMLTLAIIPVCGFEIVNSIFEQIYSPQLKSKKIALVFSVRAYLAFGLSVLAILLLSEKKYYGQVIGTIITMFILAIYFIRQIRDYFIFSFDKDKIKYILSYAVPQIPYYLSGVILVQFGRMLVSKYGNFSDAGMYSFAASIGGLMAIVISVTHQAWNPYYFKYMNEKDYISYNKDINLIWKITLILALFLSGFGYEIGYILAPQKYHSYLYMIPIFVLGYVFYQWAYIYLRNIGYSRKTLWNSVAVFIPGFFTVFLSAWLIPHIGNIAAAISFVISYIIMLFIAWAINKWKLHLYAMSFQLMLKPLLLFLIFFISIYVLYFLNNWNYWIILFLKIVLTFSFIILIFWKERVLIQQQIKKMI